jgi:hypothetical protein
VKSQWETERGQRVAYVQALPLKDSKPKKA